MKPVRSMIQLSVLAILACLPMSVAAQDCTWCYQCDPPFEDRVLTDDNHPGPDFIASPLGGFSCREWQVAECDELIECPPSEEDDAQVAELIALIEAHDAHDVIDEARNNALERINRKRQTP